MEVQGINKATVSRLSLKESAPKDSVSFNTLLDKKQADLTIKSFQQKMQEIENQGSKLAESRTIENLRKYKKLVKDFMRDVVNNGLQLKEQRSFNQFGSSRTYKLVKEIDQKLVELTNVVVDKEQKGIDLLGMVGEIKGMLINFYT